MVSWSVSSLIHRRQAELVRHCARRRTARCPCVDQAIGRDGGRRHARQTRRNGSPTRRTSGPCPSSPADRARRRPRCKLSRVADHPSGVRVRVSSAERRMEREGAKGVAIAVLSTLIVFGVVVALVTRSASGRSFVDEFFDRQIFLDASPKILEKFRRNILIFCVAELFVLPLALLLAIMRSLRGPVFFACSVRSRSAYTDLFRGLPTILVVYRCSGSGCPRWRLPGHPELANVLGDRSHSCSCYSAYVAEVYRAGIDSIHPSQVAAARSLGLSRGQSMRHVVLPQAIRRVVPPLMNDFIGAAEGLRSGRLPGAVTEGLRQGADHQAPTTFNFTPFVALALVLPRHHRAACPVRGPA